MSGTRKVSRAAGSKVEVDAGAGFVEIVGAQEIDAAWGPSHTVSIGGVGDVTDERCGTGTDEPGDLGFELATDPQDATHRWIIDRKEQDKGLNEDGSPISFRVTAPGGTGSTSDRMKTADGTITELGDSIEKQGVWMSEVKVEMDKNWTTTHAA